MTGLPENIEQMLQRLMENSKSELDIVRQLADGIRDADDRMLREVRSVALQHDVRREAIFGELQELAARLCKLPARTILTPVNGRGYTRGHAAIEGRNGHVDAQSGGDWRQAAQKIDEELTELLSVDGQRH
jgi:hypothetical protein